MLEESLQKKLIAQGRAFTHGYSDHDPYEEDFESDQDLKKPQPPLVKEPMRGKDAQIACAVIFQVWP